ncbi:MAG: hypothetical protein MPK09_01915 [Gammaproteobacteria bacterium]|nr:hypothetical protein [Gammaproteobacteria bacterium]
MPPAHLARVPVRSGHRARRQVDQFTVETADDILDVRAGNCARKIPAGDASALRKFFGGNFVPMNSDLKNRRRFDFSVEVTMCVRRGEGGDANAVELPQVRSAPNLAFDFFGGAPRVSVGQHVLADAQFARAVVIARVYPIPGAFAKRLSGADFCAHIHAE